MGYLTIFIYKFKEIFTLGLITTLLAFSVPLEAYAIGFPKFGFSKKQEKQVEQPQIKAQEDSMFTPQDEPEFSPDFTIQNSTKIAPTAPQNSIDNTKNILPAVQNDDKKVEDNAAKIKKIEFEGNKLIKDSDLIKAMKMQVGDTYSREMVQQNLKSIYSMGYFSKKMRAVPYKDEAGNVTLKIYVEENVPIEGFTIEGNTVLKQGDILDTIVDLEGKPQNTDLINQAIEKIEALYASQGYILARVTEISDDPDGIVNLTIQEGTIKDIDFTGNKKTKDFVVKRNILTQHGTIYNENIIKEDLMRLYATQAFKNVNRTISQDEEEPDKYKVTIELEEQRTGVINLGGGIDTVTGFFATLGFSENNFLGRGQRLAASAMAGTGIVMSDSSVLNRANWQIEGSWYEPHIFQSENAMMVKGFFRDFASYQVPLAVEQRYGGEVTLSRQFKKTKNLIGSIGLGVEQITMKEGDQNQINRLFAQNGIPISERAEQLKGGLFATISPSLIYDTRDNATKPRSGGQRISFRCTRQTQFRHF